MWQFLRATVKPGTLLVTVPSIEESFQHLEVSHPPKWFDFDLPAAPVQGWLLAGYLYVINFRRQNRGL